MGAWTTNLPGRHMVAKVIHFGLDHLHRVPVLRKAGYLVDKCILISELSGFLHFAHKHSAVLMTNGNMSKLEKAVSLIRSHSPAPIIFFPGIETKHSESEFDLVVLSLTPPNDWLFNLAQLIEWSTKLPTESQMIQHRSSFLRAECIRLRERSSFSIWHEPTPCLFADVVHQCALSKASNSQETSSCVHQPGIVTLLKTSSS